MKLLLRLFFLLLVSTVWGKAHGFTRAAENSVTPLRLHKNIFISFVQHQQDGALFASVSTADTDGDTENRAKELEEEEEDEETLRPRYLLLKSLCIDLFYAGSLELFFKNRYSSLPSGEHTPAASASWHILLQVIRI
jgi:hypothetical protein